MDEKPEILIDNFWAERLKLAVRRGKHQHHRAVYDLVKDEMDKIDEKHREILARHITIGSSILEVGCGYGRVIPLLPPEVHTYIGVDKSKSMIDFGRKWTKTLTPDVLPKHIMLLTGDGGEVLSNEMDRYYDVVFVVSVREMLIKHGLKEMWGKIFAEGCRVGKKFIILEYDVTSEGEVYE